MVDGLLPLGLSDGRDGVMADPPDIWAVPHRGVCRFK